MTLKVESAKESGVRRRPINRLLAARFTTNLGIDYIHNKPGEEEGDDLAVLRQHS